MFGIVLLQAQVPPMPAPPSLPPLPEGMSYADATVWLGIVIACAALVITGVGVWIGLMAIWGYRTFQEELQKQAVKTSEGTTLRYVKGDEVRALA